jgi:outer membrane lipoprotein-sorting protein
MRRITWIIAIVMCVSVFLIGCGKKDAEEVVKDLDHVIAKLESYEGVGSMILHTGGQPQEYHVEVWHKKPSYYRISLTNEKKDITQIVLRNDDGVFVLTPHLNKSFRFQSDWPENQGQVYLYQTLVQSILMDTERNFAAEKDSYVFDVVANYQNGSLARQKIWLDKGNYAPRYVEISDSNGNVMVEVKFTHFAFGKKFDKDSFDMQRNMTSWNLKSLPVMAPSAEDLAKGGVKAQKTDKGAGAPMAVETGAGEAEQDFGILEPDYIPAGVKIQDISDVKLGKAQGVLLRYSGKYNYSLFEARPKDRAATALSGTIIDLGYTLGSLIGDEKKTLIWTYEGVEFRLSSADLPEKEMIKIAQSVQGEIGK